MIREDATHLLACRHCIGPNQCKDYFMYCILLGETKSGKAKILLLGERNWKLEKNAKLSIKYVDFNKLEEKEL